MTATDGASRSSSAEKTASISSMKRAILGSLSPKSATNSLTSAPATNTSLALVSSTPRRPRSAASFATAWASSRRVAPSSALTESDFLSRRSSTNPSSRRRSSTAGVSSAISAPLALVGVSPHSSHSPRPPAAPAFCRPFGRPLFDRRADGQYFCYSSKTMERWLLLALRRPTLGRVLLSVLALAALSQLALGVWLYVRLQRQLEEDLARRLQHVSALLAYSVDVSLVTQFGPG